MAAPNDSALPTGVALVSIDGDIQPTSCLEKLLVYSRNNYDWPSGTGARESQQTIIQLEDKIAELMSCLDVNGAHSVVCLVSEWAGNNAKAHASIVNADANTRHRMYSSLRLLVDTITVCEGLDSLARLPGLSLVIASKVYRFAAPQVGASVDRHASYFFNSLDIKLNDLMTGKATHFRREWATGAHTNSRLATFTQTYLSRNKQEYFDIYLPLLAQIAGYLNGSQIGYTCAVTGKQKSWRPTDVEMAAYYWWASNGAR